MQHEYLVNLRQHCKEFTYESTIVEWGKDEFDALNKSIKKSIKEESKDNKSVNLDDDAEYDFSLSRLRPTGRIRQEYEKNTSYFDAEMRSYIKGLITRYMARFKVSDTIEELEYYKREFDDFLKNYGQEFPDYVKVEMFRQYNNRKNLILSDIVKPLPVNLDTNYMEEHSAEESFKYYLDQTVKILRVFGFRISKIGDELYRITVPEYYSIVKIVKDENSFVLNSAELILYWSDIKWYTYYYDRERYGIDRESASEIKLLGKNHGYKEIIKYCTSLIEAGLTPFFFEDLANEGFNLYMLKNEYDEAVKVLEKTGLNFTNSDIDFYGPEFTKTCEICGCSFHGDDIVCSTCKNNID